MKEGMVRESSNL